MILSEGFRDARGEYLTASVYEGAFSPTTLQTSTRARHVFSNVPFLADTDQIVNLLNSIRLSNIDYPHIAYRFQVRPFVLRPHRRLMR